MQCFNCINLITLQMNVVTRGSKEDHNEAYMDDDDDDDLNYDLVLLIVTKISELGSS